MAKKPARAKTPAAARPDDASAKALPGLLRSVLGSPRSEQAIKSQMLGLARKNLHVPDVVSALLESLPKVKDRETRDELLGLVGSIETSRFESVRSLHDTILEVLKTEKDRSLRSALLGRLQEGLHQDPRLADVFLSILAEPVLNDQERGAVVRAVESLPSVAEETAIAALERCRAGSADVQAAAVAIAVRCPSWSDRMVSALKPWLDVKVDRGLRLHILQKLSKAKALSIGYLEPLRLILKQDPDSGARAAALDLLSALKPWNEEVLEQLLWTASNDSQPSLRKRAIELQGEMPQLSDLQLESMARRLSSDRAAGVRVGVLGVLKNHARLPEVRTAAAEAFASNPGVFEDAEFEALVDLLAPYAGRDEKIRALLLKAAESMPKAAQRKRLLELVLPKVKVETAVPSLLRLFRRERDAAIRSTLFGLVRPLSVARHPDLVKLYGEELVEPSSPFRSECATALASAAETHEGAVGFLEDVLANDTDRELVRTCLDGYLKPKVAKSFDVLAGVIRNEAMDTSARQRCLDEVLKLDLSDGQREELEAILSGLKPNTLRVK